MQINRRNFLQSTAVAVTFLVSGGGARVFGQLADDGLFRVPAEAYSDPLFSLTLAQARLLLGRTFAVTDENNRSVRLTLTEVNLLEHQANTVEGYYGDSFSLIFESKLRSRLSQGIYRVSGSGIVFESVLLVPVGLEGNRHEVVINHLTR